MENTIGNDHHPKEVMIIESVKHTRVRFFALKERQVHPFTRAVRPRVIGGLPHVCR